MFVLPSGISNAICVILPLSNPAALSARLALNRNQADLCTVLQRLATGNRINAGRDDPAGLIASERLAAEIRALEAEDRSLRRAEANARIADGYTSQVSSLMQDLNGLVVSSANTAGMSAAEIEANQLQIDGIVAGIRRFTSDAVSSLDGFNMPDGGNTEVASLLNRASAAAASVATGGANSLSGGDFEAAQQAISGAILDVATARGRIGAYQQCTVTPRLNANGITLENLTGARSRISDADFAIETSNLTRARVLTAANVAVLRIAQQLPHSVLSLLSQASTS